MREKPRVIFLATAPEMEGRRNAYGRGDGQRLAPPPALTQPLQADIRPQREADDPDGHARLALSQAMDQVVEVAGHAAVITVPETVGRHAATIIQQHASPAPRPAGDEEAADIVRLQVALQARQHDYYGSARADPVQRHEIAIGQVQIFSPRLQSDPPREDRPERLGVTCREPPTGFEAIDQRRVLGESRSNTRLTQVHPAHPLLRTFLISSPSTRQWSFRWLPASRPGRERATCRRGRRSKRERGRCL